MLLDDLESLLEKIQYKNNANLRPVKADIPYTIDQLLEIEKCKNDPIYFIKNYIKVVHPDRGIVLMELYDYQERMVKAYHENKRVIFLTARQQGKTTVSAAYFVWFVLFNEDKKVAIFANKQSTADEIMDRVRLAYENLPKWIQQGVKVWNKRSIVLENGSKCSGHATSKGGNRGGSVNILYLDEFAFVENNTASEFFTSVYPTITAGKDSKVFMTSTPNGYNHFFKFWNEADSTKKNFNGFFKLRIYWHETPGRDQKWYDAQKAILGELKAAQELDAEFLGSSRQLLSSAALTSMSPETPLKEFDGEYKGLRIYKHPTKDHTYTMTCDVSRGRHLDDSAFTVYDITTQPFTVAAVYNNNEVSPLMYSNIIHKIAKNYNEAFVLVEINDAGGEVTNALYWDFEYENMYWTKSGSILGKKGADPYPGIRTTKKTKIIGCANTKDLIERKNLIINDITTIQQFSTFIQNESGSFQADEGFKDDLVMTHVLFGWLANQPWFKDLTNQDMRNEMYADSISRIEEDLMLPIFFDNGLGAEEIDYGLAGEFR